MIVPQRTLALTEATVQKYAPKLGQKPSVLEEEACVLGPNELKFNSASGGFDLMDSNIVWRCPACGMPQSHPCEECPQCGVIVAKYNKQKHNRPAAQEEERGSLPHTDLELTKEVSDVKVGEAEGRPTNPPPEHPEASISQGDSIESKSEFAEALDTIQQPDLPQKDPVEFREISTQLMWASIIIGAILCFLFMLMVRSDPPGGLLFGVAGLALFMFGCRLLAKRKGYDPGWGLVAGLVGPIGLLILLMVPYTPQAAAAEQQQIARETADRRLQLASQVSEISYEVVFDKFLDPNSDMTMAQQAEGWRAYAGKYVRWTGEVIEYQGGWAPLLVRMPNEASIFLYLDRHSQGRALKLKKRASVRFIGQLDRLVPGPSAQLRLRHTIIEP